MSVRGEFEASSTSFNNDCRKLGPPAESVFSRAADRDASPLLVCVAIAASSSVRLVRGRFSFL